MSAMGDGELCLSARVPTPGQDLSALIALLVVSGLGVLTLWTSSLVVPEVLRRAGGRWRAPPGSTGSQILLMVCVART